VETPDPPATIPVGSRRSIIQSVDRAARIMTTLAAGPGRLGVSEIAARLGLSKGTVHGIIRTLQAHALVEKHVESDKYQLGPGILRLSNSVLDVNEIRSRALSWAELLSIKTHESVRVAVPHKPGVLVVHHVFRPDETMQVLEVGALLPLHATAIGKAVLAYLPGVGIDEVMMEELDRLTGRTITDPGQLRAELAEVRAQTYAVEREEAVVGESGIAAPLFDALGDVVGAVGLTAPAARLRDANTESRAAAAVTDAAKAISRDLGARRWPAII
jgi:DNA-binding IclR family transcriptional regulator